MQAPSLDTGWWSWHDAPLDWRVLTTMNHNSSLSAWDHELAKIYVHWLSVGTEDGQYSFHVEGLSKHILDDADSLRAVQRTVKNILDWARNERLPKICKLLVLNYSGLLCLSYNLDLLAIATSSTSFSEPIGLTSLYFSKFISINYIGSMALLATSI